MILTWLMLAVALALSAVAAFYSIVGLAAIFSASVIPIVIMGSILEIAKLTVTVWLHEYWDRVKLTMKLYLVPAVIVLMIITSMGIFGFLSKAHLDQAVPTGEVAAQVSLIDEKISNERETIANARTLLAQLDKAVTDISNAPDREVNGRTISSAERALQVRRQQARDRANLTRTIEDAQKRIIQLQEQKAPVAGQLREVEAKVGPIKYIAALIYGDNPDANLLERAVRWMIILLVAVFDPLAIMMLLAFTESYRWHRGPRQMFSADIKKDPDPTPEPPPEPELKEKPNDTVNLSSTTPPPYMVGEHAGPYSVPRSTVTFPVAELVVPPAPEVKTPEYQVVDDADEEPSTEPVPAVIDEPIQEVIEESNEVVAEETATQSPQEFDYSDNIITKEEIEHFHKDLTSDLHFGPMFPGNPKKGDLFLKINSRPTALFKYNGEKWISVNKALTDRYAYNDQYINWLITEIGIGKYDPELLTDLEREQIRQKINDQSQE